METNKLQVVPSQEPIEVVFKHRIEDENTSVKERAESELKFWRLSTNTDKPLARPLRWGGSSTLAHRSYYKGLWMFDLRLELKKALTPLRPKIKFPRYTSQKAIPIAKGVRKEDGGLTDKKFMSSLERCRVNGQIPVGLEIVSEGQARYVYGLMEEGLDFNPQVFDSLKDKGLLLSEVADDKPFDLSKSEYKKLLADNEIIDNLKPTRNSGNIVDFPTVNGSSKGLTIPPIEPSTNLKIVDNPTLEGLSGSGIDGSGDNRIIDNPTVIPYLERIISNQEIALNHQLDLYKLIAQMALTGNVNMQEVITRLDGIADKLGDIDSFRGSALSVPTQDSPLEETNTGEPDTDTWDKGRKITDFDFINLLFDRFRHYRTYTSVTQSYKNIASEMNTAVHTESDEYHTVAKDYLVRNHNLKGSYKDFNIKAIIAEDFAREQDGNIRRKQSRYKNDLGKWYYPEGVSVKDDYQP